MPGAVGPATLFASGSSVNAELGMAAYNGGEDSGVGQRWLSASGPSSTFIRLTKL
jgi:hypothetical protein